MPTVDSASNGQLRALEAPANQHMAAEEMTTELRISSSVLSAQARHIPYS
jgi:hypothetical protein